MPKRTDIQKVLIIGAGPIIISQACEFDYSGTQACKALKEEGYEVVLVNSNPATIMTDPGMADVTYIEPLNAKVLTEIIARERPDALLPNLGGQSGLNLSSELHQLGVLEAHPDLAGKLAAAKRLTPESTAEQASAGLDALTDDERAEFTRLNEAYTDKFGFPFIIAVRDHDKAGILSAFSARLENDRATEFAEACRQVERIALHRLKDLLP